MTRMATKERTGIERNDADWLLELLADVRKDVAYRPRPQAIARIRARLLAAMDRPVRAAA